MSNMTDHLTQCSWLAI